MQSRITTHGKNRVKERVTVNRYKNEIRNVRDNGKSMYEYRGRFFQFLMSKHKIRQCKIKVYQHRIYIFSKNTKRLITAYSIPNKYIPTSNYEIGNNVFNKIIYLKRNANEWVNICLYNGMKISGYIEKEENAECTYIKIRLLNNSIIKIAGIDIDTFKVEGYFLSEDMFH